MKYYRSQQYSWSTLGKQPIALHFLEAARSEFKFPVIKELYLRVTATFDAPGGAALPGEDIAGRFFSNVLVRDGAGTRMNVTGQALRVINQIEYGDAYEDPSQIAAAATNTERKFVLRIPFNPLKSRRRADTFMAVTDLLNGGSIVLDFCAAAIVTGANVDSGTIEVWALVEEGHEAELKSRMVWLEYNATNAEDYYPVNGSLRCAFLYASAGAGGGYTTYDATDSVDSTTLGYIDVPVVMLKDQYLRESHPDTGDDEIYNDYVIPIVTPSRDQKIGEMPDVKNLHLKVDALESSSKLVLCVITDRHPELAAKAMGFKTAGELTDAVAAAGVVKASNGKNKPVAHVPANFARRLPVKVKGRGSVQG